MSRWLLLALLFLLSFLFELTYTAWSWAVANDCYVLAIAATAAMPWIGLVEFMALIDAKGKNQRIMVCCVSSAGFALGTATVLWMAG